MVDLGFVPYRHQREAHEALAERRFGVLVWHRRAGKTVFSILELVLGALSCKRGRGRFAYVAPYYRQGKAIAWQYLKDFARKVPGTAISEAELVVTFANGAQVRIYGADNPDSLRGLYFDGIVLDEVADMRPEVWGEIVRPALADRKGWALFIGTPKGVNLFSERYHHALGDEDWHADLRTVYDTDAVDTDEIDAARREMGESQFAQEFLCDFAAAAENVLISLEVVLEAQQRTVPTRHVESHPRVLGVDVARYGDDRSVIAFRQGPMAFKSKTFHKMDLMSLASQVGQVIADWKPQAVFVDEGGMGGGVVDRLRQLGHNVLGVQFGAKAGEERFQNRRIEMWWRMAEWLSRGDACLPNDHELTADLTSPTYTYKNAGGRMQLESKDQMRARGLKSPDVADALALTFAEPVAMPTADPRHNEFSSGSRRSRTMVDPYERLEVV